jgi:hypothetical protein
MVLGCPSVRSIHAPIYKLCVTKLTRLADPLSISHISSGTNGVSCTFHGIDNSDTTVNGAQTVDVGPPQTQVYGSCHLNGRSPQVSVSFIGAADAQFSQSFPVDGSSVQISKSTHENDDGKSIIS